MFGFLKKRREAKKLAKFLTEVRVRRHADDDLLSAEQRVGLDALIAETAQIRPADAAAFLETAVPKYHRIAPLYRHFQIRAFLDLLLVVGAVAFGIRGLFFQPFRIPTSSMQPTLYGIHFLDRENASNPVLGKLPNPLNWLLFSARPAKLEIQSPGELDLNSLTSQGNFLSDSTGFRIGGTRYSLPGDIRKVEEYSNLEAGKSYAKGDLLCDGFLSLGDHLFVERFSIYLAPLKRGDVIVFNTDGLTVDGRRLADASGFYYIKRLVGLPGDTLKIVGNQLYVKPQGAKVFKKIQEIAPAFEKIYSGKGGYQGHLNHMGRYLATPGEEFKLGPDRYFMMGDNSSFSLDSRFFGAVPRENLVGKAWIVFWPFTRRWGWVDRQGPIDAPTGEPERGTFKVMYRQ